MAFSLLKVTANYGIKKCTFYIFETILVIFDVIKFQPLTLYINMKKLAFILSLSAIAVSVSFAGNDKEKEKKSCSKSSKTSCCSKTKAACDKKTEDVKPEQKPQ